MPAETNIDVNKLTDEEYLVFKVKESLENNPYESKAWMLTAISLFPQSFDIQFEAYLIEKKNGNAEGAAKCFTSLFQSFVSENGLWEEITALTNALRSENPTPEEIFFRNMFSHTSPVTQHELLTVTAERSEDTMEHCRLMLLLFTKFPQNNPQLTIRLVETLVTAEKHGHCPTVINCFRKTLVCEVLPMLLHTTADISSKQLYRLLHKSIEFYLAYLTAKPNTVENLLDHDHRNDISWESFFKLLRTFGSILEWELCSMFKPSWNRDEAWQQIVAFHSLRINTPELNKNARQLIYCLTILFSYSLHQYNINLNPENRCAAVLVEAFVNNDQEESLKLPPKKMKMDLSIADPNFPTLSAGKGVGDIMKHFNYAFNCWNLINANDVFLKEFVKLKQYIKLDQLLLDFMVDIFLYLNKLDEFHSSVVADGNNIRNSLQKLAYLYITKNYPLIGEISLSIVKQLDFLPVLGNCSSLIEVNVSRHLHFLPLAKIPVLQYVVKLLVKMYWHLLPNVSNLELDRVYGSLLVLCQMSWPSESRIVLEILKRIRANRSFSFPLFFEYVVNIEILEEFMHIYANEQDLVKLDLMESSHPTSVSRMSTRGVDKEVREDFRLMMKQQVSKQEPLYTLIIQFLVGEERLLCLK